MGSLIRQCKVRQENGIQCILEAGHPPLSKTYKHNFGGLPKLRPGWDDIWMSMAHGIAQRSLCTRDQVGAVIVSVDNAPLMASYNGPPAGFDHQDRPCTEWCQRSKNAVINANSIEVLSHSGAMPPYPLSPVYEDCPALHAEANAISRSNHMHRQGGTIYVTSDVCHQCAKLIANSGITTVVVDRRHPRAYRQSEISYEFLETCGIDVVYITEGS